MSDVGSGVCMLTNQSRLGVQEADLNDTLGAETECQTERKLMPFLSTEASKPF